MNRKTSQRAIRITSAGIYSVLVDEIRMALGWARTRESERGLFGYTERGLDDENTKTNAAIELRKGNQWHIHICQKGASPE